MGNPAGVRARKSEKRRKKHELRLASKAIAGTDKSKPETAAKK